MTTKARPPSGTSKPKAELPQVLRYPPLLELDQVPAIKNVFCYIIRHYGTSGFSVLVYRKPKKDEVVILCGDWQGNNLDLLESSSLVQTVKSFIQTEAVKLLQVMHTVRLEQAQYFFALDQGTPTLVDIQLALNKMSGPGMVRDVFGRLFKTQEVLKTEIVDDRVLECVRKGTGSYSGDVILKPTAFKLQHLQNNKYTPMYVQVIR